MDLAFSASPRLPPVAVTYGGGQFVAVGDNGTIISSPDGYNWKVQTSGVFPNLRGVAYADGEYAAVETAASP